MKKRKKKEKKGRTLCNSKKGVQGGKRSSSIEKKEENRLAGKRRKMISEEKKKGRRDFFNLGEGMASSNPKKKGDIVKGTFLIAEKSGKRKEGKIPFLPMENQKKGKRGICSLILLKKGRRGVTGQKEGKMFTTFERKGGGNLGTTPRRVQKYHRSSERRRDLNQTNKESEKIVEGSLILEEKEMEILSKAPIRKIYVLKKMEGGCLHTSGKRKGEEGHPFVI